MDKGYKNIENENYNKYKEFGYKDEIHPSFGTKAIHVGQEPEPLHGAVNIPVYLTSTYAQKAPNQLTSKYDYSRCGNPTVDALRNCLASLEHGKFCTIFSSGCSATNALISILKSGDEVISVDDVYGGTNRQFNKFWSKFGIKCHMLDLHDYDLVRKSINPNTKMIWVETPSNPTLKVFDIKKLSEIAKEKNIILVVDNTFATPYLQSPLLLGADVVLHSCTKYIGGHSDVIAGALITNNKEISDKYDWNLMTNGGCISPFDAFVLLRSLKTLKVRVKEHCRNANAIAKFLSQHSKVEKVIYPGLENHPHHEIAKNQMRDFGGMISFVLKGKLEDSKKYLSKLKVFTLAESLGGIESLVELPYIMTHASVPEEERNKLGINETFIRLSVGIEDLEDLIHDLDQAFN